MTAPSDFSFLVSRFSFLVSRFSFLGGGVTGPLERYHNQVCLFNDADQGLIVCVKTNVLVFSRLVRKQQPRSGTIPKWLHCAATKTRVRSRGGEMRERGFPNRSDSRYVLVWVREQDEC